MKFNNKDTEQKEWAKAINLIFTNQNDRGNHINVAGGGVTKYSKNKANAIALLEFLTQPKAQELYAKMNYEYPVNSSTEISAELFSWGKFKEDKLAVEKLAELALVFGVSTAWIVTRYNFPGKKIFEWALLLPAAVPAYIIAYTYTEIFEYAGPFQSFLRNTFDWNNASDYWFPNIRSIEGAILVMSAVLYPYVYLMTRASF